MGRRKKGEITLLYVRNCANYFSHPRLFNQEKERESETNRWSYSDSEGMFAKLKRAERKIITLNK